MNLINLILENGGDAVIGQIARKFGMSEHQATQLLSLVMPTLGQGIKQSLAEPDRLNHLTNAMAQGGAQKVLERPEVLQDEETSVVEEGNSILGQVFGSKDVSRAVASRVAEQAGTDPNLVKQLLPIAATLAMGALGKESQKRGVLDPQTSGTGGQDGLAATCLEFLDMDDDCSVLDDIFTIAKKFI